MPRPARRRPADRRRDEGGAIALHASVVTMVLLVVCPFVSALGMTWHRRGDLQPKADQAALFAAEALPATDEASRPRVAKRAAFSIVCDLVSGQRTLDPAIPDCPDSPTTSALDDYGQRLLDDGLVTFPSSTQVQVIS